jgi:hypothetical protein
MRKFHHATAILGLALLAHVAPATTLEIALQHSFNGDRLLLDSLRYQNAAGETLSVTRLSYLLSGIALEREDGAPSSVSIVCLRANIARFVFTSAPMSR